MKITAERITATDFDAVIFDVQVFGVTFDCNIDCWYETGVDGDTELMECVISTGDDYELKENGPWYKEILSAVEDEIKSKIYDWQTKQFEADREQGGC